MIWPSLIASKSMQVVGQFRAVSGFNPGFSRQMDAEGKSPLYFCYNNEVPDSRKVAGRKRPMDGNAMDCKSFP